MKALPFIELTRADQDGVAGGPTRINAKFIQDHCFEIAPHPGDSGVPTTSLIFPGGIGGMHVKDSYEQIEAKMAEALTDGE